LPLSTPFSLSLSSGSLSLMSLYVRPRIHPPMPGLYRPIFYFPFASAPPWIVWIPSHSRLVPIHYWSSTPPISTLCNECVLFTYSMAAGHGSL
jgi:hypothetical protein